MSGVIEPGSYLHFVAAAYVLTGLGVVGLIVFILAERISAKRFLAREEDEASK
jgi:heme exporter protein CcmD